MNETLRPLPWQQDLWVDLTARVLGGRLPHALLLAGPAGVGKRRFAVALAAFVLCEARSGYACGTCRSCQQLAVGAHANASLVSRDGHSGLAATVDGRHEQALVHWQPDKDSKRRDVSIHAARSLMSQLALTSHYGQAKLALIDPADELNDAAVNALLKTVEEPPPRTHVMLVSERPQGLKPTLRSRCQTLRFSPPERGIALDWLRGAGVRDAEAALDEARGAPLLAAQWAGDGQALDQRRAWAELWRSVAARKKDPISAAGTVPREEIAALLDWLLAWLGGQLGDALAGRSSAAAPAPLSQMIGAALGARRRLDGNAQPQLLLEALLIEWARLTRPSAA